MEKSKETKQPWENKLISSWERKLIGKDFESKRNFSKKVGYIIFASMIDGVPMVCTADLNLKRIKVHVKNGLIVKVAEIG